MITILKTLSATMSVVLVVVSAWGIVLAALIYGYENHNRTDRTH